MMPAIKENFGNSMLLTRFVLRREKFIALAWVGLLALVVVGVVPVIEQMYGGTDELVEMLDMPALVFMVGPNYAAAQPGFGPLFTTFMLLFTALTVGIMNIFLITRYTRADEERGRYEVIRSLPLGRLSGLNAALITAVIVNAAVALVIGLGLWAIGDYTMDFHGSVLWGVSLGATGLVFAAITAFFSQLSSNTRGVNGYSFALLAAMYIVRAPGDMNPDLEILSLISPLGLVLRTQAYIENNWWPIWILLGIAVAISALAFKFNSVRDIDQGIIHARAGRSHGSFLMRSTYGLTFKLLRGSLFAWLVGMFVLAATYGSILGGIDEFIAGNDMYQQLIFGPHAIEFLEGLTPEETAAAMHAAVNAAGFTLPQLFSGMITNIMGIVVIAPVVIFALRAKSEEKDIRAESVLATKVCRNKYLAGFVGFAFIAAVLIQIAQALGMYSAAIVFLDDPAQLGLGFLIQANLMYVPALWVMIGLTVFLIGFLPKATGVVWGYFGFIFLVMFFGRLGAFPDWLSLLSPFEFVPILPLAPGENIAVLPLAVLTGISAMLTAAGFVFYNKRDINAITH